MDIVQHVTNCISNKISGLADLENNKIMDAMLNDTKFIENINVRFNMCKKNKEEMGECLQKLREDIFKETETLEDEIMKEVSNISFWQSFKSYLTRFKCQDE